MSAHSEIKQQNNKNLADIFREEGQKHGFASVAAEFSPFREFKVRWQRTTEWADFQVSDYLDDASDEVLRDLAAVMFARIGGVSDQLYAPGTVAWLTSPAFREAHRPVYLRRVLHGYKTTADDKPLRDSVARLKARNLLPAGVDPLIVWYKGNQHALLDASRLMQVITVSELVQTLEPAEDILDSLVYMQALKMIPSFNTPQEAAEFQQLRDQAPGREAMEAWLVRYRVNFK